MDYPPPGFPAWGEMHESCSIATTAVTLTTTITIVHAGQKTQGGASIRSRYGLDSRSLSHFDFLACKASPYE